MRVRRASDGVRSALWNMQWMARPCVPAPSFHVVCHCAEVTTLPSKALDLQRHQAGQAAPSSGDLAAEVVVGEHAAGQERTGREGKWERGERRRTWGEGQCQELDSGARPAAWGGAVC